MKMNAWELKWNAFHSHVPRISTKASSATQLVILVRKSFFDSHAFESIYQIKKMRNKERREYFFNENI